MSTMRLDGNGFIVLQNRRNCELRHFDSGQKEKMLQKGRHGYKTVHHLEIKSMVLYTESTIIFPKAPSDEDKLSLPDLAEKLTGYIHQTKQPQMGFLFDMSGAVPYTVVYSST
jgi:hypothetical protein